MAKDFGDDISMVDLGNSVHYIKDQVARASIPFGRCDSTSTATAFTATVPGITSLYDGVCVMLENGVVTSASGFTLSINGLTAKPVYNNLTAQTRDTTIFNKDYTMLFVYDATRVSGGCWICYRGYDSNTNTIGYQLRTNSTTKKAKNIGYRYRLWFTSADDKMWVPANVSSATNNTTARLANQEPIDPFGAIIYNSYNGTTNAGGELGAAVQWEQYTLSIGYSFTDSLPLTDNAPVYVKCAPLATGSAIMQGTVEALPTQFDGYIYIYLGQAYNTTNIELRPVHPVYWHDGTGIRLWTGGSSVYVAQTLKNGTEIGSVTVDGLETKLYAPSGGDVTALTDTEIQEAVDEAFVTTFSIGLDMTVDLLVRSLTSDGSYGESVTTIITSAEAGQTITVALRDENYLGEPTPLYFLDESGTEVLLELSYIDEYDDTDTGDKYYVHQGVMPSSNVVLTA